MKGVTKLACRVTSPLGKLSQQLPLNQRFGSFPWSGRARPKARFIARAVTPERAEASIVCQKVCPRLIVAKPECAGDFDGDHANLQIRLITARPDAALIEADLVIDACPGTAAGEDRQQNPHRPRQRHSFLQSTVDLQNTMLPASSSARLHRR